jgi:glycosyltransferase involved in cell wall biosynthesis
MNKIAVDTRMINNSGIGTYLQNIIPNLIKNYELILLGREKEINSFHWGKKVKIINFNSSIYSLTEQLIMPLKIPECDIFLSPHYNIPILPIKAKKRVVVIHDVYHLAYNIRLSLLKRLYSKFMVYSAVHLSDQVITSSQFSKSEILKYEKIKEAMISVIYFGFNFEEFSNLAYNFEPVQKKYNLPSKYFLFVGNIKPHKNLYNLLQAFRTILEKEMEIKLIVVGEYKKLITSDKKSFELLDENTLLKNNTIFTGFIGKEELVLLYKNASALVFPSFYEGFGIPPVEAMACGCPVISSNAASLPEACGDAALFINPDDINDISQKMVDILTNNELKNKLIGKGRENVKRFPIESLTGDLNKVLDSLFQ